MSPPHVEQSTAGTSLPPTLRQRGKTGAEGFVLPDLTIKELRDAIPAHCFERDTLRSLRYVAVDVAAAAVLVTVAIYGLPLLPLWGRVVGWCLYAYLQSVACTGLWVLAHECGHQAFSASKQVNNGVGYILHSLLLVPYHAWRISHAQHHAATGHMTKDQVFVPKTRSDLRAINPVIPPAPKAEGEEEHALWEETPIAAALNVFGILLVGWPAYLIRNASGQTHYPKGTSHFNRLAPMYRGRYDGEIIMSTAGVVATFLGLLYAAITYGPSTVTLLYVAPYLGVNAWLVLITFLQHTDPSLPHYRDGAWTFVRGALLTIDRDFGAFHNTALHHITDTHVAHHLFSQMPHYHAEEATAAIIPLLKEHYRLDKTHPLVAACRSFQKCHFVEDEGDIVFFKQ